MKRENLEHIHNNIIMWRLIGACIVSEPVTRCFFYFAIDSIVPFFFNILFF